MENVPMKIVKLDTAEYAFLKQSLMYVHFYGKLDESGQAQLTALLSKLDSAVVEDHRDVLPEKASDSGCVAEP